MRANPKEPQPVRLANPTAESFVASLKVVHFFAIFFLWLVLAALSLHLVAFVVFQAGAFDAALDLAAPASAEPSVEARADAGTDAGADRAPEAGASDKSAWWSEAKAQRSLEYVKQLLRTMRLVGLLASMLLLVTLFVYLEISLLGRLAGVRYLTMSFFLMLVFVATVYSWEPLLPGTRILGSLYVVDEFLDSYTGYVQRHDMLSAAEAMSHYGRFLVMPLASLALLVFSWLRFRRGYEESVLMNE